MNWIKYEFKLKFKFEFDYHMQCLQFNYHMGNRKGLHFLKMLF